jgi:hypothetical protein
MTLVPGAGASDDSDSLPKEAKDSMTLPMRDVLASVLVGLSVVIYLGMTIGIALPGLSDVTGVAVAVLVLGIAASISAVVPGFDELLHGSRLYLVAASLLGAVALVGGVWALLSNDATALAVLVLATVVLWGMSTARHMATAAQELASRH